VEDGATRAPSHSGRAMVRAPQAPAIPMATMHMFRRNSCEVSLSKLGLAPLVRVARCYEDSAYRPRSSAAW
jgi:hypothetical protein